MPVWARDLPVLLAEVYAFLGCPVPPDPEQRLIDLVEWVDRMPARVPRRVHVSRLLKHGKILTPYEIQGIRRLTAALERGHSVASFMGERTKSVRNRIQEGADQKKRNDLFFSDWPLHHFHLGADLLGTGKRVVRSRRILIAHLTREDAYLLDVVPHGKGFADVWGDVSYLEVLYRNWPEVMGRYEMKGILAPALEGMPAAMDYLNLRAAGLNVPVRIDGKVFLGPGLGIASDGSAAQAVRQSDVIRKELDSAEKLFREQEPATDAMLFVTEDASVGFFVPDKNMAMSYFPGKSSTYNVTAFFRRLLEETGMLRNLPHGSIWIPASDLR